MLIRPAKAQDAQALSELASATYTDAFGFSMPAADLAAHLAQHLAPQHFISMLEEDIILVAQVQAQLVGFVQFGSASATLASATAQDQEIRRLYVHAAFQRQGIGTQLLGHALADPHLVRAKRIFLDVWEHNYDAQRLYERFGFSVVGARPFVVASGAATSQDLIMVRHGAG